MAGAQAGAAAGEVADAAASEVPGAAPVVGPDGLARCPWAVTAADYQHYHDHEWGRPVRDDTALFERLALEGFQSGLSWLTVLRKRAAFRECFAGFDPATVAGFDDQRVAGLLLDARLIRHGGKIRGVVHNAGVLQRHVPEGLGALVWSFAPSPGPAPVSTADIPTSTPASTALAAELRRRGWRLIGPTTAYAAMQACGLVNDHLAGCGFRDAAAR